MPEKNPQASAEAPRSNQPVNEKWRAQVEGSRRKRALRRSAKRQAAKQAVHFQGLDRLKWAEFEVDVALVDRHARRLLESLFGVDAAPNLRPFEDWALAPDSFMKSVSIATASLRISAVRESMGGAGIGGADSRSLAGAQAGASAGSEQPETWSAWLQRTNLSASVPSRPDPEVQSPPNEPGEEDKNERSLFWKDIFHQ